MGNNTAAIREAGFSIPPPDDTPRPDTTDWDSESSCNGNGQACNGQDAIEVDNEGVDGPVGIVIKGTQAEGGTECGEDADASETSSSSSSSEDISPFTAPFTAFREYHELVKSLAEINQRKVVVNIHLKYVKCECDSASKNKKGKRLAAFCVPPLK